jgi:hypothetical protein
MKLDKFVQNLVADLAYIGELIKVRGGVWDNKWKTQRSKVRSLARASLKVTFL